MLSTSLTGDLLAREEYIEELVRQRTGVLEHELAELKQVEDQLRNSEEKYRQLIHSSNDGIYLLYNRKFELVNDKFCRMLGISCEDLMRADFDFMDFVAPQSRGMIEERYRRLAIGKPIESRYEFVALTADGREFEVETSVTFINYKNGLATQGVLRDITQRKQMESQQRQAQRIEALTTLAGGIAHDFNNILAIIRGYSELVLDDLECSQQQRNLQHVISATDRARELVDQIITFSRQGNESKELVDMPRIMNEILYTIQSSLPDSLDIQADIDPKAGFILGQTAQLRKVVLNLCTNALQAMKDRSGVLQLRLEKIEINADGVPNLKHIPPGPYIKLTVKDCGHGMGKETVERIFEPYFTTKATGEGSGMGLAVIYGIIKNYGGDIAVETELQKGTTFTLYLPRQDEPVSQEAVKPSQRNEEKDLPGGNERILLVDDPITQTHIQQEILEPLGYYVMTAGEGIEAIDIFREDSEIYDLVILGQELVDMTGIQLAQQLLKIKADIPILMGVGFGSTMTRDAALKAGIKGVVMKPLIIREIAGAIRSALDNTAVVKPAKSVLVEVGKQ